MAIGWEILRSPFSRASGIENKKHTDETLLYTIIQSSRFNKV
jgi:hypothetical protein